MFKFIMPLIAIAIIIFIMPIWNHRRKLDYMKKQGYSQMYKTIGYAGHMELTFVKGYIKVTEGMHVNTMFIIVLLGY